VGLAEVTERAADIVRATDLPLVVDIDTGYGGVLNAVRAARLLVEVRAAGVQIEDQRDPKKCGHLSEKSLAPPEELEQKIRAIKAVCPTLYVIARTDAHESEGIVGVVTRARRYLAAGADAIFPEALTSEQEFRAVSEALRGVTLLANLSEFGKTPPYTAAELASWGYRIILFPVSALRIAARAMERLYRHLQEHGTTRDLVTEMQTRAELYETIGYFGYEALDNQIARSTLPQWPATDSHHRPAH
jgi:methylisocitrate lyase